LVETIYRYNNKERIKKYLARPELLTDQLYHDYREEGGDGGSVWNGSETALG
jgi:hypothetical protein